jgi:ABC-2 type transport system ATP-binding protein
VLTFDNVRKRFGKGSAMVTAVDGLSLDVRRGEVLGLLGPNGAGKSTTVNMAIGLVAPDSGTVRLDGGHSPTNPGVRRKIGVAPQALALYDLLSGEENLRFIGELYDLPGALLRERVHWALAFVGLVDRRRDRVDTYSGGMKRRLNLAAALIHDPELVLLDEPTAGVDPQSRNQIFDNILGLKQLGRTVIYTTHYMEEAERLCDRIAIIDRGRLLALGTVQELLDANGVAPRMVLQRGSLEEVFLNLTGKSLRDA